MSPVKNPVIHSRYRTGSGRSTPSCSRSAWTSASLACSPSCARAGSPGRMPSRKKTTTEATRTVRAKTPSLRSAFSSTVLLGVLTLLGDGDVREVDAHTQVVQRQPRYALRGESDVRRVVEPHTRGIIDDDLAQFLHRGGVLVIIGGRGSLVEEILGLLRVVSPVVVRVGVVGHIAGFDVVDDGQVEVLVDHVLLYPDGRELLGLQVDLDADVLQIVLDHLSRGFGVCAVGHVEGQRHILGAG